MSRFRELVAECERDELEQTQEIFDTPVTDGVHRMTSQFEGRARFYPAPELSERYAVSPINMTVRQAE